MNPLPDQPAENLHPDLAPYVVESGVLGQFLKHPLVFGPMLMPALYGIYNGLYAKRRQQLAEAERTGEWSRAVFLHERPYRLQALLDRRPDMDDAAVFWSLVAEVYRESENVYQCRDQWLDLLAEALPHRHLLMASEEREALAALPQRVTVYRGSRTREDHDDLGFSWTTSQEKARWYALRFPAEWPQAYVMRAEVERDAIIAFFEGGDGELIVMPDNVKLIKTVMVNAGQQHDRES